MSARPARRPAAQDPAQPAPEVGKLVRWLRDNGLRVSLLHSISAVIPPSEEQIVTRLALLASGLTEPEGAPEDPGDIEI